MAAEELTYVTGTIREPGARSARTRLACGSMNRSPTACSRARVTPDNRLLLADNKMVRLRFGREMKPLSRQQTKRAMDGWLPVMLLPSILGGQDVELSLSLRAIGVQPALYIWAALGLAAR